METWLCFCLTVSAGCVNGHLLANSQRWWDARVLFYISKRWLKQLLIDLCRIQRLSKHFDERGFQQDNRLCTPEIRRNKSSCFCIHCLCIDSWEIAFPIQHWWVMSPCSCVLSESDVRDKETHPWCEDNCGGGGWCGEGWQDGGVEGADHCSSSSSVLPRWLWTHKDWILCQSKICSSSVTLSGIVLWSWLLWALDKQTTFEGCLCL